MQDRPLERRRLCDIEAAIERAKAYAAAQEVPLTVERLAALVMAHKMRVHRMQKAAGKSHPAKAGVKAPR